MSGGGGAESVRQMFDRSIKVYGCLRSQNSCRLLEPVQLSSSALVIEKEGGGWGMNLLVCIQQLTEFSKVIFFEWQQAGPPREGLSTSTSACTEPLQEFRKEKNFSFLPSPSCALPLPHEMYLQ